MGNRLKELNVLRLTKSDINDIGLNLYLKGDFVKEHHFNDDVRAVWNLADLIIYKDRGQVFILKDRGNY